MRQTTGTGISQQIREKYGRGRGGKTYRQIAHEFGVSRQLVQTVLTKPLRPRSPVSPMLGRPRPAVGGRPRSSGVGRRQPSGMPSLVVRVPGEDLNHLRIIANSRSQTISSLLREILIAYCRQLRDHVR